MKVKFLPKARKSERKKREKNTDWPSDLKSFLALKPTNLLNLEDSVMVCSKAQRPNLSRAAQTENIKYLTIPLKGDDILVLRYKIKRKE